MANEKRLIDANALVLENSILMEDEYGLPFKCVLEEDIRYAPTVDAVPVVHGRWNTEKCDHVAWRLKNPDKWVIYKCSVCGYSNGRRQSNYCPNCGAKMDGDGNG